MKQLPDDFDEYHIDGSGRVVEFCYKAKHVNIFGHAVLCTRIEGVSRNFMAQVTRHNHTIFTCSSQHYQDYRDYPTISFLKDERVTALHNASIKLYSDLVDEGIKPEDAREVLPACSGVNMYMTCNAIQWAHIMRERMCNRNTREMRYWASHMYGELLSWFPELFKHVGPQCLEDKCKQGRMRCKERRYDRA